MRKLSIIVLLLSISIITVGNNNRLDSVLRVLDNTLKHRPSFEENKINSINQIGSLLIKTYDNHQKFDLLGKLFKEYVNYQIDSAALIANERIKTALDLKEKDDIIMADLNLAETKMVAGMYKESLDILQAQDRSLFNKSSKAYIYHLYHSLYILMVDYTIFDNEKEYYREQIMNYKDSILSTLKPDELGYSLVKASKLIAGGDYEQAIHIANECLTKYKDNRLEVALIAYNLSDAYHYLGNREKEKFYLAISAIEDMRLGTREYISLRKLAVLLYEEGDIDRAYLYMKQSMEDAIQCNARLRTLEISQMLPIINTAYDLEKRQERDRLLFYLVIISLLSCVLVVSIIYIYKQLKALARARRSLKEINNDLKQMNDNLKNLNIDLSESDRVKEEYISYVFNMCSVYIDKLDEFRKKVNRKIKAGQVEDLYKQTNSASFVHDELKDFYRSFDTIFLSLYPNFVEEFNSLLHPDEQIFAKDGELLSPELRIYALVRLGINDSVKIASFLHYSSQTVYNYRLKVRNKAISKDGFLDGVGQIGRPNK